ncbi:hypothetical protein ASPFODRAFT_601071 [Aspergillus luchuensis CBS 106.47]|uniref:Uncharacterized protein n=1 Tax=Aspergillus luchuensis (strain CBS 106.47) TaxID=1137211 RepID=A0A1M3TI35_ASPLC|nr:hypothetical protein ASPFODRAFT_601071 [Aspergillus luchuensis CBS 106.47]
MRRKPSANALWALYNHGYESDPAKSHFRRQVINYIFLRYSAGRAGRLAPVSLYKHQPNLPLKNRVYFHRRFHVEQHLDHSSCYQWSTKGNLSSQCTDYCSKRCYSRLDGTWNKCFDCLFSGWKNMTAMTELKRRDNSNICFDSPGRGEWRIARHTSCARLFRRS